MDKTQIQSIALEKTVSHSKCGLGISMGVGKTLIGLKHIERETTNLMKVLVIAPKKSIFTSWIDDAGKFGLKHLISRITFSTYRSFIKHDPTEYDIIYLDECHSLLDSHRLFLDNFKGKILGLTGTPPRYKNSEKGRLVNQYCPIIYEYLTDEAIDHNILNDYKIIVHKISLTGKRVVPVTAKSGKVNFNTSEVQSYEYWNKRLDEAVTAKSVQISRIQRMKAIQNFPSKERYAKMLLNSIDTKCIVFANTQDQADRLCEHSYHSQNSDSEENLKLFKDGKINKLSSVLQLSEGVNIPNLKQGIIMHAYGNERKSSQRIGRLLRLNPDDTAIVHILCYVRTIDEKWVEAALDGFDQNKIEWRDFNVEIW